MGKRTANGAPLEFIMETALRWDSDECLHWPYASIKGYGVLAYNGKRWLAHRLVCRISHGPSPDEANDAAHECGKGHLGCVNPKHLKWKSRSDNISDKILHGTHKSGDAHWNFRVTPEVTEAILAMKGKASQRRIGEKFGVSQMTVSRIHSGKAAVCLNTSCEGLAKSKEAV